PAARPHPGTREGITPRLAGTAARERGRRDGRAPPSRRSDAMLGRHVPGEPAQLGEDVPGAARKGRRMTPMRTRTWLAPWLVFFGSTARAADLWVKNGGS